MSQSGSRRIFQFKEPHPDLVYAQVVKERKKGRIVKVTQLLKNIYTLSNSNFGQMVCGLTDHALGYDKKKQNNYQLKKIIVDISRLDPDLMTLLFKIKIAGTIKYILHI